MCCIILRHNVKRRQFDDQNIEFHDKILNPSATKRLAQKVRVLGFAGSFGVSCWAGSVKAGTAPPTGWEGDLRGEGVSRFARICGQILEPISPKRQVLTLSIWYSNQYAIAGEI